MSRLPSLTAIALLAFSLAGCDAPRHEGCSVEQLTDGSARITCPDGSSAVVAPGTEGEAGASCTVEDLGDGVRRIRCEDGSEALIHDGAPGDPGASCTVEDVGDGVRRIRCEDGSEVLVHDGEDGGESGDGLLVEVTEEPAGYTCAEGGVRITVGRDLDGDGTLSADEIERTHYLCGELDLAEPCGLLRLEDGYFSPAMDETEVLPLGTLHFALGTAVDDLTLALERADGAAVAGSVSVDLEEGRIAFTADGLLEPSTLYEARLNVAAGDCLAEETWSFTTSSLGTPITDEPSIAGRSWRVDLSTGTGVLTQYGITLRLQALDLDAAAPGGKTLELILASEQDLVQDTCHATVDAVADFALSPYFQAEGARMTLSMDLGEVVIRQWRLSGLFTSDLTGIGGVAFEGYVDVTEAASQTGFSPGALCDFYAAVNMSCEPCPDEPEAPCVRMWQEMAEGSESLSGVIPVAEDQTENHLCPGVCENGEDDDGDGLVDGQNPECDVAQWP